MRLFIFLNTTKSGERGRFDAAHELGHLVFTVSMLPLTDRAASKKLAASRAAFLMPRASVLIAAENSLMDLETAAEPVDLRYQGLKFCD